MHSLDPESYPSLHLYLMLGSLGHSGVVQVDFYIWSIHPTAHVSHIADLDL